MLDYGFIYLSLCIFIIYKNKKEHFVSDAFKNENYDGLTQRGSGAAGRPDCSWKVGGKCRNYAWHGSSNISPPTDIKDIAQKQAKAVHQHIQKSNKEIILPGITNLNFPINFNGQLVTLRQTNSLIY